MEKLFFDDKKEGLPEELGRRREWQGIKLPEVLATLPEFLSTEEQKKQERIAHLRFKISEAEAKLAHIEKEEKIEEIEKEINKKRKELKGGWFGKKGRQEEIATLETKIDRINFPFKWFLVDEINKKNRLIVFGSSEKTKPVINEIIFSEDPGRTNCGIYEAEAEDITRAKDYAVRFSSNGFYLRFANKKELEEEGDASLDNPDARYDLISPQGEEVATDLSWGKATESLQENSEKYQQDMRVKFEDQNN